MKFLAFGLILLVFGDVSCQFTPAEVIGSLESIRTVRFVSNMVRKNCNERKDLEFQKKIETMQNCYLEFKGGKETFCGMVKNHLVNCSQPVVDTLEQCVDKKFHDVPKFLLETANSVADYVCRSKGEKLIELLHPCMTQFAYRNTGSCIKSFEQKFKNIQNSIDDITDVKKDFCSSLETTKSCILKNFKKTCHNHITLESAIGFYDALVTKPCKHI